MALTTYAELKTALSTWTRRGDIGSYADDLITVAEKRIFREVRCREMEAALSVTMSSGVASVPTDYTDLKYAYIDGTPIRLLERKEVGWILGKYPLRSAHGKPYFIGRDVDSFVFGPYPDSNYTVKGTYYKKLSVLSSSVNTLYTNQPDLYLAASLKEVYEFLRNEKEAARWNEKYENIRASVSTQDKAERASGGPLMMVVA